MIAYCDVNTIWRAKLAEALAETGRAVAGLAPHSIFERANPRECLASTTPLIRRVPLLPGWASATRWLAQPRLSALLDVWRASGPLILTTHHYLPLARLRRGRAPILYYCSDDYRSYEGWNAPAVERAERRLLALCDRAVFVSRALAERAIGEGAIDPSRVSISMNATDPRFLDDGPAAVPEDIAGLPRPLVGVVGALNRRIDIALLAKVAALPALGTLLVVGPVDPALDGDSALAALKGAPRCRILGPKRHGELHLVMRALDVALMPYAPTPLNHYASPMRLFDHLASGAPIIATAAADQVRDFETAIAVARSHEAFLAATVEAMRDGGDRQARVALAKRHLWRERGLAVGALIDGL